MSTPRDDPERWLVELDRIDPLGRDITLCGPRLVGGSKKSLSIQQWGIKNDPNRLVLVYLWNWPEHEPDFVERFQVEDWFYWAIRHPTEPMPLGPLIDYLIERAPPLVAAALADVGLIGSMPETARRL